MKAAYACTDCWPEAPPRWAARRKFTLEDRCWRSSSRRSRRFRSARSARLALEALLGLGLDPAKLAEQLG